MAWQRAVRTFWPLPTFLYSLFPRGGWTHALGGRLSLDNLRMGTTALIVICSSPSLQRRKEWLLSTLHPTLYMLTPNTDLAPTGLGRVESLPWGMNIKTLGWLLPMVIRSKALPCSDVPMTGLQQQKAAEGEDSSCNRLGRKRGSSGRPGPPDGCQRAWVLCRLLSQNLNCPGAGCTGNPPLYHGSPRLVTNRQQILSLNHCTLGGRNSLFCPFYR